MSKSTAVEPFTPPPPQEGCNCGVCKPFIQNAKYQAAYEAQSASPFVRYKYALSFLSGFPLAGLVHIANGSDGPVEI